MKFDMGAQTLTALSQQTQSASDDLGALISQLITAAEPLQGNFNGAGRAAFDAFKANADAITADLRGAANQILGGQVAMDAGFAGGEAEFVDNASSGEGAANYDAARFGATR